MNRMGKPFFTLIHRRKQGFTLVELIVVIAILAILAGVAIPIYSNYVKRANEASDLQLISAVNTAFAAACLENGKDAKNVTSAELTFDESGKRITGVTDVDGMDSDAVNASFQKYFGDNTNAELRYYTKDDIHYNSSPDPLAGTFSAGEGSGGAAEPLVYTDSNGQKVYYTAEQILAYRNSHYHFEGATEQWTETVDSLVGAVGSNATTVASLRGDAAFRAFLTADGVDAEHATGEELGVALVRYVASKVSGLDAAAVVAAIGSDDMTTNLMSLTKLISGKEYNQAAFSEKAVAASLLFAVSGGYDGSDERLEDETFMVIDDEYVSFNEAKVSDRMTLLKYMNTMDRNCYRDYLANSATADVEGLLAVMQLVNGNSDVAKLYTSNASEGHYYSNDNVIDLISGLLAAVPED